MNRGISRSNSALALHNDTQRHWPRFARRLSVAYRVDHAQWHRGWREGFTTDAGPMGLRVASAFLPGQGSRIQLRVEVPGSGVLEMWGRVAWNEASLGLANRAPTSFGVKLSVAPEEWFQYCYRAEV